MDFHTLSRKELQVLCKKNKIPANLTNLAMADSLSNLIKVEGIEEIGNSQPPVSQTPQTCKGSRIRATKDAVVSMDNEPNSISITTRARVRTQTKSTQEDVIGVNLTAEETFQTPATRTRRRAIPTSVCKNLESAVKGDVPVDKAIKEIEKPIGSRYATRRSARLVTESKVPESASVTLGRRTKAAKVSASEEEPGCLVRKQSFVEKVEAEDENIGETHGVETGESVDDSTENSAKQVSEATDHVSIPEDVAEGEYTVSDAADESPSTEAPNVQVSEIEDSIVEADDDVPNAENFEVVVDFTTEENSAKEVSEATDVIAIPEDSKASADVDVIEADDAEKEFTTDINSAKEFSEATDVGVSETLPAIIEADDDIPHVENMEALLKEDSQATDGIAIPTPEDVAEEKHAVSEVIDETPPSMETLGVGVSETLPVPEIEDLNIENVEFLAKDLTTEENSAKKVSGVIDVIATPEDVAEAEHSSANIKFLDIDQVEDSNIEAADDTSNAENLEVLDVDQVEDANIEAADDISNADNVKVLVNDLTTKENSTKEVSGAIDVIATSEDCAVVERTISEATAENVQVLDVDQVDITLETNNERNQLVKGGFEKMVAENETEKVIRKVEFDVNVSVMGTPLRNQVVQSPLKSGSKLKGTPMSSNKKPATPFPKMVFKVLEEAASVVDDDDDKTTNFSVVAADDKENSLGDDTPQRTLKKASLRQLKKMVKEKLVVSANIKEKTRPALKTLTGNNLVEEN